MDLELIKDRLVTQGISAEDNETLKNISEKYNKTPIDLLKIILVDKSN